VRNFLRCGNIPVGTTDGEVTCPNQLCPESRISFTIAEWEDVRTIPAIDFIEILKNIRDTDEESLSFLTKFMTGQITENIDGVHLIVYMISQVSSISMSIARMNSIVNLLEGKYK